MEKTTPIQKLRQKHQALLSNKAITSVVKSTETNTDLPTNEKEYLAKAKKNISLLKSRIKSIQRVNEYPTGL